MPRNNGNTPDKKKNNFKNQKETVGKYPKKNYALKETKAQKKEKQRRRPPTMNATSGKTKLYFAKRPEDRYGDPYEYKMSRFCANEILRECPNTVRPEQYLCDFVTEQYGLLGWCQRVIIEG